MSEHKCDTCNQLFETCSGKNIVWGIDKNPFAIGAEADRVIECEEYEPSARNNKVIREQQN